MMDEGTQGPEIEEVASQPGYKTGSESTAYSNVGRIVFSFSGILAIGIGCYFFFIGLYLLGLVGLAVGYFSIKKIYLSYKKVPPKYCGDCGQEMSPIAVVCPSCGALTKYGTEKRRRRRGNVSGIGCLVVFLALVLSYQVTSPLQFKLVVALGILGFIIFVVYFLMYLGRT